MASSGDPAPPLGALQQRATASDESTDRTLDSTLKPSWVFAMAVGSAVGWGAFILPVDWLAQSGTVGALVGLAVGTLLIAVIGISYGVVIRVLPVTGGELAFALQEFGRRSAFVVGWFLALAYACLVALNATAVALVLRMLAPGVMERVHLYTVAGWDVYLPEVLVAVAALLLAGVLNSLGTSMSGRFQLLAVAVMAVTVLVILGAAVLEGLAHGFRVAPALGEGVGTLGSVGVMIAFAPWAYVGFNNVPQTAGEFDFSPRRALVLILAAIATAGAMYLAMTFATSVAVGATGPVGPDAAWATADAIEAMVGPLGTWLMVIAVLMGIVTGLNGFTVSASRIIMTMARSRMLPAALGRVSPRRSTPMIAVLVTIGICLLAPFFGRSALLWIVDMTSVGVTIAYGFTCLAAFRLAHAARAGESAAFGRARPLYRAIALAGVVLSIGFLLLLFVPGSPGRLGAPPLVALGAWCVLGAVFLATRHRALMAAPEERLEAVVLDVADDPEAALDHDGAHADIGPARGTERR